VTNHNNAKEKTNATYINEKQKANLLPQNCFNFTLPKWLTIFMLQSSFSFHLSFWFTDEYIVFCATTAHKAGWILGSHIGKYKNNFFLDWDTCM
jgi:hypothetical protein